MISVNMSHFHLKCVYIGDGSKVKCPSCGDTDGQQVVDGRNQRSN